MRLHCFPARPVVFVLLGFLAVLPAGCGAGGGDGDGVSGQPPPPLPSCANAGGPPITIEGDVRYERLVLSPTGIGPTTEMRDARFADVEIRHAVSDVCYGRDHTDANGHYSLVVLPPTGEPLKVVLLSRTSEHTDFEITVHNRNPPSGTIHDNNAVHTHEVDGFSATGNQTVDVDIPYGTGAVRPSIGFGILDVMLTCAAQVNAAASITLPELHVYCMLGNNAAIGGSSAYSHARRSISILGGAAGSEDTTDTDYFDDAVLAHEFGHFVERSTSHSQSRGGPHAGERLEPAFAWSEGQATGFGCLLLADSLYVDSMSTNGGISFAFDVENAVTQDPTGIGGELTCAEIVWDLGDGAGGIADTDGDAIALPLSDLYAAMMAIDPFTDGAYVGAFLQRIESGTSLTAGQIGALMIAPEPQGITYPLVGGDVWPTPIAVGGSDSGTCDARLSTMNVPGTNTLAASAWYRLSVPVGSTVTIDLTISSIAGSGDNLDLYLFRNTDVVNAVASSRNPGAASESIGPTSLTAGEYIIVVEAVTGNRADYTLEVN